MPLQTADCNAPTDSLQHMMLRCTLGLGRLLAGAATSKHLRGIYCWFAGAVTPPTTRQSLLVKQLQSASDPGVWSALYMSGTTRPSCSVVACQ
jgi:hypothetical protein